LRDLVRCIASYHAAHSRDRFTTLSIVGVDDGLAQQQIMVAAALGSLPGNHIPQLT
jgi:hypothetical protein